MKDKLNRLCIAVLTGLLLLMSGPANAKDSFDGSSNLLCAAFEVMACLDGNTCRRGEARTFDLPDFMTVDFKNKVIHATHDGGTKEANSPIKNYEESGTQLVLQGTENGHGWTMAIHRDNGRMSLAAVGEELSFSIFGACKAL